MLDEIATSIPAIYAQRCQRAAEAIDTLAADGDRSAGEEGSQRIPAAIAQVIVAPTRIEPAAEIARITARRTGQFWRVDVGNADFLASAEGERIAIVDMINA